MVSAAQSLAGAGNTTADRLTVFLSWVVRLASLILEPSMSCIIKCHNITHFVPIPKRCSTSALCIVVF